ncbi:superoxide dismutase family protein [Saliterribacillus persicus]|uniref:Cu-Zn family superoxide dismutase n=1 Tax=Saliterribacillus persicus TaxID=930114 RepID=A0A368XG15_9BACI|nr:superoxide dismutase family protein [Saliterribacillus persicus]RCW66932.1 Cu-Zn family superoxide dismutase [Saliterribacillus persicus]
MKYSFALLTLFILVVSGCSQDEDSPIEVALYNTTNDRVGSATFVEGNNEVKVNIKLEGLEPGFHGIHMHESPLCEGPDFKSAGNHFNPTGKEHGLMHPDGAHLGDFVNIEVDPAGTVETELVLSDVTLLDGDKSLLREEGTSIIVHEKEDDGISQPSGDAGDRIVCGVLSKTKEDESDNATDPTEFNEEKE